MIDEMTSWGEFSVALLIVLLTALLVRLYCRQGGRLVSAYIASIGGGSIVIGVLFSCNVIPFDVTYLLLAVYAALAVYLGVMYLRERFVNYLYTLMFVIGSVTFFFSTDYVFNQVLENHQKTRIEVLLGMKDDPAGAGYNVNQSKIAIGSGGLLGKGFLNGTQTKLKYVPEQDTDFIFCTVGEEQGFFGSAFVLLLLPY